MVGAQTMRAVLLANATATNIFGLRANILASQGSVISHTEAIPNRRHVLIDERDLLGALHDLGETFAHGVEVPVGRRGDQVLRRLWFSAYQFL